MAVLIAAVNQFRGVVVDPEWLPEDAGEFGARLEESLAAWREQGLLAVWAGGSPGQDGGHSNGRGGWLQVPSFWGRVCDDGVAAGG